MGAVSLTVEVQKTLGEQLVVVVFLVIHESCIKPQFYGYSMQFQVTKGGLVWQLCPLFARRAEEITVW